MVLILGVHVAKKSKVLDDKKEEKKMSNAIMRDLDTLDLNAAQIFTYGPRFMVKNKMNYNDIKKICNDIDLTVHSTYGSVSIWKVNDDNKNTPVSQKAINSIKLQLESCASIGAWGLVLHITKHTPENISKVMKILKPFSEKLDVKIILEMVSSKADSKTYETPEKINVLTKMIGHNENWWCWCVDTAHLWGAGVDIQHYNSMSKWLNDIKHPEKIEMFHLNGSSAIKGSGKDKHEIPFSSDDLIWGNINPNKSGLRAVVEHSINNSITIICEINRGSEKNVVKCMNYIKKLNN